MLAPNLCAKSSLHGPLKQWWERLFFSWDVVRHYQIPAREHERGGVAELHAAVVARGSEKRKAGRRESRPRTDPQAACAISADGALRCAKTNCADAAEKALLTLDGSLNSAILSHRHAGFSRRFLTDCALLKDAKKRVRIHRSERLVHHQKRHPPAFVEKGSAFFRHCQSFLDSLVGDRSPTSALQSLLRHLLKNVARTYAHCLVLGPFAHHCGLDQTRREQGLLETVHLRLRFFRQCLGEVTQKESARLRDGGHKAPNIRISK